MSVVLLPKLEDKAVLDTPDTNRIQHKHTYAHITDNKCIDSTKIQMLTYEYLGTTTYHPYLMGQC
jgi:hypothetical protein